MNLKLCGLSLLLTSTAVHAAPMLTADPLTQLPLIPATAGMPGNHPQALDPSMICQSKMQANTYSVVKANLASTTAWYTEHLSGLKHVHVYSAPSTKEGYYNADGSVFVIVLGAPGAEHANVDTYSVTYYTFSPGLPDKVLLNILHDKVEC